MKAISLLIVVTFVSLHVAAKDSWQVPVDRFQGLDIGTGIEAEVICGEESTVLIRASERAFESLRIDVHGSTLDIKREHNWRQMLGHRHGGISATIHTTEPLRQVEASTGSAIEIDPCAVSANELDVSISTGATVRISGQTQDLDLRVGTGGTFNEGRFKDDLRVERASVRLSTGANAGLCAADLVVGRLSTGSQIVVSEDTDVKVRLGTGADVDYSGCW
ncbi:MAG: DUF2807 domain-containing protein [Pseudomonadales bacterium]|nr:DUF2807 domain-containing protein [Pseudomonadales bacterium]MDP7358603.1 DUF2807 domain-containing protein [Pseudomonadales bacterium]MDP7596931.1 DUF2807 domain-containing protein [Pseudomonadales bacterium]HJN49757.1 DUF2807 domain-containing protein [Pseudomonadales bacterium]